jgi:lambda family phage portal protein
MQDYMQAELTTQQAHSKWIAFVTSKGTGTGASWDKAEWNDTRKKWEERLDFATMELLKPGQEVTLNSVQRSPDSVTKFTAQILRMVAASTGLPYEIISKDYQGLNYSVSRQVRNDFKQELKPKWATIIAHLCRPIFERWLDKAVLRGDLKIPDYFERRRDYQRGLWIPPGLEAVDPVKDVQAAKEMIAAGLSDPQSFIMGRGKDPEHVMANLKKWKADLEAGGLSEVWDLQFAAMTAPLVDDNANNSQNNADQGDE